MRQMYQCDTCKKMFATREEAERCEHGHEGKLTTIAQAYYADGKPYPKFIDMNIEGEDYVVVQYAYVGLSDRAGDGWRSSPIEAMKLTTRTFNALKRGGIDKIGDLIDLPYRELVKIRNMGRKSILELAAALISMNIQCDITEEAIK